MEAVLIFIDGTICDMRHRIPAMGSEKFFSEENLAKDKPTQGSVECLNELAEVYELVYIGARPDIYTDATHKWLLDAGFPEGKVYLGSSQQERLDIVKELKKRFVFRAGIGDRWDDNELHLELGCQSFILKEWSPDWDVVRKHLEMKLAPRVRYSQFNAEDIKKELLQRYELEQPLNCRFYDFGMNDIYLIRAGNTNYYLRISLAGIHQRIDYLEEMNIIKTLAERGIRAAVPVKMAHAAGSDNPFVWELAAPEGIRYAALFTEAPKQPSEDNESCAFHLGRMLAMLHRTADEENFRVSREPIDMMQLAEKPLAGIRPYLENRPADYRCLKEGAAKLKIFIKDRLSEASPEYGFCHGDLHSGNVFFEGVDPTIFDFDCMGYGWRAYDICVYAWDESFQNEKFMEGNTWKKYLEGYESVRPLSREEKEAIPAFAALRELWMIGLHAEVMEKNAGCCWHQDDYFDYQLKVFRQWLNRCGLLSE